MVFRNGLGWIGVDLGTHTVKLAQAVRTADGVRLGRTAVIQRPSSWTDEDALAFGEPDPSGTEIAAALECGRFRGRNAACLLPMNACELRGLKVPQGNEQERRAMIASEMADDASERAEAVEFDYWELGGDGGNENADGFNVNVMSVARPWISQVSADCQRSNLDCWAVDGTPLAIARAVALAAQPRSGERILAVDWGFSNTTLCVVAKNRPSFSRRLHECHFRRCLESIESALGVTLDHAQHLVDVYGVVAPGSDDENGRQIQTAITNAIAETVASLVEQIQRTLRFVELQRRQQHPGSLWIMGGGACVHNIGPYLSAALGMPVSIWNVPSISGADDLPLGRHAALFGNAFALSTLAWRAA